MHLFALGRGTEASMGVKEESHSIEDPIDVLYSGQIATLEVCGDQFIADAARKRRIYLPGSYNPLHEGHRSALLLPDHFSPVIWPMQGNLCSESDSLFSTWHFVPM